MRVTDRPEDFDARLNRALDSLGVGGEDDEDESEILSTEKTDLLASFAVLTQYAGDVMHRIGKDARAGGQKNRTATMAFVRLMLAAQSTIVQLAELGVRSPDELREIAQRIRDLEGMSEDDVFERFLSFAANYLERHPEKRERLIQGLKLKAREALRAGVDAQAG